MAIYLTKASLSSLETCRCNNKTKIILMNFVHNTATNTITDNSTKTTFSQFRYLIKRITENILVQKKRTAQTSISIKHSIKNLHSTRSDIGKNDQSICISSRATCKTWSSKFEIFNESTKRFCASNRLEVTYYALKLICKLFKEQSGREVYVIYIYF